MSEGSTSEQRTRGIWAAHVRLYREMGNEDDAGNVRSANIIRHACGHIKAATEDRSEDPWLPRAKAILAEEWAARGVAGGAP